MTTLTFRRLRQAELIKWFQLKYGKLYWRSTISAAMGRPVIRTYRWCKDDISGRAHEEIEAYAYTQGFVSIYDECLHPYYQHGVILEDFMRKVAARITRQGDKKTLSGAAFPLDTTELDELLAGLNYKLVEER